ncbi:MAG: electron transport complex subunit RsxC [Colwellia sp.]|nr:electron transport complex subunit RsxC [Colwellia sp.]
MVESILERITRGHFWDFHGGIHPPEQKTLTSSKPIKQLTLPKQLIIPLQQHIGREGDLLVSIGDKVLKGQALTISTNPMVVPIHAPTSGTISAIKPSVIAHPSGLTQLCIFLEVDGEDTWHKRDICTDIEQLSNEQIIEKIANAGIAGMGGAGFPTHIKLDAKPEINFLIINGAECEPYITSDDLLMMEQGNEIVDGIKIIDKLLSPAFILIAIEDNKPKAIKALQQATANIEKIKVCAIPTKYPAGGEKQLIKVLTGREISSGSLPIHSGIMMQNIATCFAINDAVRHDIPLIRRVVTVTGQALNKPQNVWALLGTPIKFLLEQCDLQTHKGESQPVIMGGPMMGFCVPSDLVPIVKTSNCILVPSKLEMPSAFEKESKEVECIRCGQCSDVCPSQLLPQEMQWSAKAKDYPQLKKLNLSDCIDCGACAYVCPSQIPLVHYYRIAKAEIREQQQLDLKAEKAKVRFEARKLRLEKEKIARQEKHKKAAAARKAAMNKATPEAVGAKSAVAAALARVKAKKAGKDAGQTVDATSQAQVKENIDSTSHAGNDQKSQVAAAIARAKAKKKLKTESANNASQADSASADKITTAKTQENTSADTQTTSGDAKKAKIAAAIAKAKAKKLNKTAEVSTQDETPQDTVTQKSASQDEKKAKVAAAIAKAKEKTKAKAKERANAEEVLATEPEKLNNAESDVKPSPALDKKAKIAATIAKAKAKKQLKEAHALKTEPIDNMNKEQQNSKNELSAQQPDESN